MNSADEHSNPPAASPHVDNLIGTGARNERIGFPRFAVAAGWTVRLRQRRQTIPESSHPGRPDRLGQVSTIVDNFALRELSSLALSQ